MFTPLIVKMSSKIIGVIRVSRPRILRHLSIERQELDGRIAGARIKFVSPKDAQATAPARIIKTIGLPIDRIQIGCGVFPVFRQVIDHSHRLIVGGEEWRGTGGAVLGGAI